MSLYDVARLSGLEPVRGASREQASHKPASSPAQASEAVDKGVSVQTGARVSAGPVSVDANRVTEIREALRDGSYPIVPAKITDAIIAARLMLSSGQ